MSAMSATCTPVVFSVNTTRIQRANDPYSGFKPIEFSLNSRRLEPPNSAKEGYS